MAAVTYANAYFNEHPRTRGMLCTLPTEPDTLCGPGHIILSVLVVSTPTTEAILEYTRNTQCFTTPFGEALMVCWRRFAFLFSSRAEQVSFIST